MADDESHPKTTAPVQEDLSREALNVSPENKPFVGKQWQDPRSQPIQPPENANLMVGGTQHTAGGKLPEVTLSNAVGSIKIEEFKDIAKKPCVRESLMTGIGAGFGLGSLRAILRGKVWTACNWAAVTFMIVSVTQYQYCQYRRHAEKEGMLRVVEVLNNKELERKARDARREQAKAERRKAKDEEQDAQLAALKTNEDRKSGWKWW